MFSGNRYCCDVKMLCFKYGNRKPSIHLMHLFISDLLDIRVLSGKSNRIRYPAFRLAGYPAKSVSGASILPNGSIL
jgi:hypothetical protein